ncbi:hypothetical protein G6F22_018442 [Rhizopus arrhizus]|nr:hypothetical protein G6F22_018442 [Rhizopus arrhizus]
MALPGVNPFPHLAAGLVDDPFPDGQDQAGLFGDGNELVRADQTARGVVPAQHAARTGRAPAPGASHVAVRSVRARPRSWTARSSCSRCPPGAWRGTWRRRRWSAGYGCLRHRSGRSRCPRWTSPAPRARRP